MKPEIIRHRSRVAVRMASEIMLIAGSIWLFSMSVTELVRSFTVYRGYEVALVRGTATLLLMLAAAMAFLGVRMIRSSKSRWIEG